MARLTGLSSANWGLDRGSSCLIGCRNAAGDLESPVTLGPDDVKVRVELLL